MLVIGLEIVPDGGGVGIHLEGGMFSSRYHQVLIQGKTILLRMQGLHLLVIKA